MTDSKPDWRSRLIAQFAAERGAQTKFARAVGCSEPHLSLVLKGKRGVSYALAGRISGETGIPVEELMKSPPIAPSEPQEAAE